MFAETKQWMLAQRGWSKVSWYKSGNLESVLDILLKWAIMKQKVTKAKFPLTFSKLTLGP
jgi:hypothetical protein